MLIALSFNEDTNFRNVVFSTSMAAEESNGDNSYLFFSSLYSTNPKPSFSFNNRLNLADTVCLDNYNSFPIAEKFTFSLGIHLILFSLSHSEFTYNQP